MLSSMVWIISACVSYKLNKTQWIFIKLANISNICKCRNLPYSSVLIVIIFAAAKTFGKAKSPALCRELLVNWSVNRHRKDAVCLLSDNLMNNNDTSSTVLVLNLCLEWANNSHQALWSRTNCFHFSPSSCVLTSVN